MATGLAVLVLLGFLFLFNQSILAYSETNSRGDISIAFTRGYGQSYLRSRLVCQSLVYLARGTPLAALFHRNERLVDALFRILAYREHRLLDTPCWMFRYYLSSGKPPL
jgi:hypothetical protein